MGLPFRLFNGAYTFAMMSVALFILTCGILGKKIIGQWPLRKFCVSDFRQKQEYHMYAVHDEACSPCLPLSREDGTVCAPLAA